MIGYHRKCRMQVFVRCAELGCDAIIEVWAGDPAVTAITTSLPEGWVVVGEQAYCKRHADHGTRFRSVRA